MFIASEQTWMSLPLLGMCRTIDDCWYIIIMIHAFPQYHLGAVKAANLQNPPVFSEICTWASQISHEFQAVQGLGPSLGCNHWSETAEIPLDAPNSQLWQHLWSHGPGLHAADGGVETDNITVKILIPSRERFLITWGMSEHEHTKVREHATCAMVTLCHVTCTWRYSFHQSWWIRTSTLTLYLNHYIWTLF